MSRPLGVSHPFVNRTLKRLVSPLYGPGVPKRAHAPINHHVYLTDVRPLPCSLCCANHHDSSRLCQSMMILRTEIYIKM
jgi:hypothetical protein